MGRVDGVTADKVLVVKQLNKCPINMIYCVFAHDMKKGKMYI